jgi:predicted nucleotidyltransferase
MRTKKKNVSGPIDWLFPRVRKEVLVLLFRQPQQRWYLRDIQRRTGSAMGTVRRELNGLADADILLKTREGNRVYYQANTACPFYPELAGLIMKTAGLADVIRTALSSIRSDIQVGFVFGSVAEGDYDNQSDVDLMLIGSCTFGQVAEVLGGAQKKLAREINPSVFSANEWKKRLKSNEHFVSTVIASAKIYIIGSADELEKLAE